MTAIRKWLLLPVLIGLLATTSISAGRPLDPGRPSEATGIDRAIEVADNNANFLLASPNVVGVGVTLAANGQAAVLVLTAEKDGDLPSELGGVSVVERVSGALTALQTPSSPTDSFARPVPIGISTGNEGECSSGTIGARVKDAAGNLFALSNNHVYALENAASIGSKVLQPGRLDLYDAVDNPTCGFSDEDVLGQLSAFEQIKFRGGFSNKIDAAIASVTSASLGTATPADGYGTPSSDTVSAVLGQAVQKYGRTTSLTNGTITGINVKVRINYTSGTAGFSDQIIIESPGAVILPGDSGSLLVTDDAAENNNPVGLMFAGNSSGTMAIANRIDLVLAAFDVTIDDGVVPTPGALEITTASLPNGTVGQAYSATLTATGGTTPYGWALATGDSLPAGLSLDGTSGEISGIPTAEGIQSFTVEVTDSDGATDTQDLSINVNAEGGTFSLSVSYATEGGRNGDKHLLITFTASDASGTVSGVTFSHTLSNDTSGGPWGPVTGTTGADGTVTFTVKNAPVGCYSVTVHSADDGWDNTVTDTGLCK